MNGLNKLIDGLFPGPMLQRKRRILVGVLAITAAVLIFVSFFLPYWHFTLVAPQYPQGLHVTAYLNRLEGDVRELDILNHYIGMKKMEDAAQFEKKIAFWAITLISIATIAFLYSRRTIGILLALPAVGFPIGFVADLFFGIGFYLAVAAAVLLVIAVLLRLTVCNSCPVKDKCGLLCSYSFKWKATPDEFRGAGMIEKAELASKNQR